MRQAEPQAACTFFPVVAELVRTKNHFVVDVATSQIASPGVKRVMRSNARMRSILWMEVRFVYLAVPVSAFFMAVFAVKQLGKTVTWKGDDTETRE